MSLSRKRPSSAFVYDFMLVPGGAEQLALEVLRNHPSWDLVTGFVDEEAIDLGDIRKEQLRRLGKLNRRRGLQGYQVMRDFHRRGKFLADYENVVFSGVYGTCGVVHRPPGTSPYYCHTPPRFAYDLEDYYLDLAKPWQRPLLRGFAAQVRHHYAEAMALMGPIAANSRNVARRLEHYLGIKDVKIIHPPVATENFRWKESGGYFLSTARVEPYKRVSWAVKAFMGMPDKRLVVASGGSELDALRAMASSCDNIEFTGWCSSQTIQNLVGACTATLYLAQDEDFGISPVESMAAGKPVIGVAEGGLLETVKDGVTGALLPGNLDESEALDALKEAVIRFSPTFTAQMRDPCEQQAKQFDRQTFRRNFDQFSGPR